jgi:ATP-binding cassette subfamily B protein
MMSFGGKAPTRPIKKETTKRVIQSFFPYVIEMALITILVLASVGLSITAPFFLRIIVDKGIVGKSLHIVALYSIFSILAVLGSTALQMGYGYLSIVVGQKIMRDLRNQLFDHLQRMAMKFFTNTRTGEIMSRLANDVGGVQSVLSDTAANLLFNLATAISTIIAMFILDWRLTLLSIGVLPLFAYLNAVVGERLRKIRGTIQQQLADLNSTMNESLSVSGVLLTKVSGRRTMALDKFTKENQALTDTNVLSSTLMKLFFTLFGVTFSITPVLVYWLAGYLIVGVGDSSLKIGTIVAFTSMQGRLFFPLSQLASSQVEITSAMALFDRIFEYLDMKLEIVNRPGALVLSPDDIRGEVTFENVTFRYDESQERPTLDNVSLEAKPGQLIALVGASGAGKTSLTYLLPRLYDTDSGSVKIDGIDVRDIDLDSLANFIAVVTQETYLVHDTIRENLRYGKPTATNEEIEAASKAAAIHDHIISLPEGYGTVVGERGYKLSGGEKQRVAIARAILKSPRILILDEATSALDNQSERLIQQALAPLMQGRTTFAVAHRLSTVQNADQILVLSAGSVIERGSHSELLALDGEYARLYRLGFELEAAPAALAEEA